MLRQARAFGVFFVGEWRNSVGSRRRNVDLPKYKNLEKGSDHHAVVIMIVIAANAKPVRTVLCNRLITAGPFFAVEFGKCIW